MYIICILNNVYKSKLFHSIKWVCVHPVTTLQQVHGGLRQRRISAWDELVFAIYIYSYCAIVIITTYMTIQTALLTESRVFNE